MVIYTDLVDEGDKAELVWPEFGKPYFQQITKADNGVNIARMVLTSKPYVADEGESAAGPRDDVGQHLVPVVGFAVVFTTVPAKNAIFVFTHALERRANTRILIT